MAVLSASTKYDSLDQHECDVIRGEP